MRRRRAVSAATSAGSPRSQPSLTTMTTPLVRSVRRAQCWLNVRKLSPIRVPAGPVVDRVGHAGQRAVAVAVLEQPGDPGQPRPEHERLDPHLAGRREGLDEAQQQPRVALHRAADVGDDDERARLADRSSPDPRHELAAGPEVAPEHRPRRQPAAVRVQLVATGAALLQARDRARRRGVRRRAARPGSSGRTRGGAAARRASRRRARRPRPRCRCRPGCRRHRRSASGRRARRRPARARWSPGIGSVWPAASSPSIACSLGRWSGGAWKSPWRRLRWRHQRSNTAS